MAVMQQIEQLRGSETSKTRWHSRVRYSHDESLPFFAYSVCYVNVYSNVSIMQLWLFHNIKVRGKMILKLQNLVLRKVGLTKIFFPLFFFLSRVSTCFLSISVVYSLHLNLNTRAVSNILCGFY